MYIYIYVSLKCPSPISVEVIQSPFDILGLGPARPMGVHSGPGSGPLEARWAH